MNKKNIPLIVGLLIPVVMVLLMVAAIYIPRSWAKAPTYDFVYAVGNQYYGDYYYQVTNNRIERKTISKPAEEYKPVVGDNPKLYYYDIAQDVSRELSFEQAQAYSINSSMTSPDGFEIVSGNYSDGIFPFGGTSRNYMNKYIKGNYFVHKLNLNLSEQNYYNFSLLGWVNK